MWPSETAAWFARRTSSARDWPAPDALAAKGDSRISVVLPARDEAETIGGIVRSIRESLMDQFPLVDELVVIDSRSSDDTALVATSAGALVVAQDEILADLPPLWGKGEALWKSLAVTSGDVIVFIDSDIRNFAPHFVTGLLGPILADPTVSYVKACYDRPLTEHGTVSPCEGGRVTEILARPLINMCWPELSGILQPLAGEYAGRRSLLENVPFVCGYGVEIGLLIDIVNLVGLDGIAQVDLGVREHANQSSAALGRMSGQILDTVWTRLYRRGLITRQEPPSTELAQFTRTAVGYRPNHHDIRVTERPPMADVLATRPSSLAPEGEL
ncbi:glucosyl-3-phosphoglycerate synthase [Marinactinospora thermotolerans]|uniref:Glucosyl-3-phosphoglycerate synthase n=1 Tax=Marinactinospora thermotolerans DSM 45154 TaxID=1122192 RepID=A0A1T4NDH1_9ACTN|nr:glucosyl-3-phosphoglycerate synthase [Marinactinospora thermotolerans]SJZ77037.1 glucosyl-3-phosphoglycerate synthase [Marinactinospora thermotolerans DSM 45154]